MPPLSTSGRDRGTPSLPTPLRVMQLRPTPRLSMQPQSTLRRRRNTSSDKELPPVSVVATRMKEIQAVITAGPVGGQPVGQPQGYLLDDRVNADETASS
jgi:hypothetical protein